MSTTQMHAGDDTALYNIGVVSRMTGIPVATLRVWERRYGFPESERTKGGHRIYSGREVDRLRWVKERVDSGMQAGRAVKALHHHETHEAGEREQRASTTPTIARDRPVGATALASLQERFAQAVLAHDPALADQVLAEVLTIVPVEDVILHVIRPTLVALGQGWVAGEVSVATEHLASYYIRQKLLSWLATGTNARNAPSTVLACAPDDWHEIGLLMLGVLVSRQGWPILYLGPAVPLPDLAKFVRDSRPAAVVLVSTAAESAEPLREWPTHMPSVASSGTPPVFFAGRGFALRPDLIESMPGQYLGDSIEMGVERLVAALARG